MTITSGGDADYGIGALEPIRLRFRRCDVLDNLFQPVHLLVILFIALLVFGPKKLPELGKGLGEGIRSFKESMNAVDTGQKEDDKSQS
jgi:sec-independent protein translocase protein TatA